MQEIEGIKPVRRMGVLLTRVCDLETHTNCEEAQRLTRGDGQSEREPRRCYARMQRDNESPPTVSAVFAVSAVSCTEQRTMRLPLHVSIPMAVHLYAIRAYVRS